MAEKALTASSLEDLSNVLSNTAIDATLAYSLSISCPLTNAAFIKLYTSELGHVLRSLDIGFDPDEYKKSGNVTIDTAKARFPALKRFQSVCQSLKDITFTAGGFPELEELTIEQPNNHPQSFNLNLPNLKLLHFEHMYLTDGRHFGKSLSRCPKLECFCSYKLWGLGCLREHVVVAPSLQDWEMQRSDDLEGLTFWAPRLEGIRFKSCDSLNKVDLLEKLPAGDWGPEYRVSGEPSTYEVSFFCCDLPGCEGNLLRNKRCGEVSDDMDDFQTF